MSKPIAQHPIAVALVGALALVALLLALSSFVPGHASAPTVAYHPPFFRNRHDVSFQPPFFRNRHGSQQPPYFQND